MSKGWGKAWIPSLWGHFAGSIASVWHSQADFCYIPDMDSELCLAWKKILAGKNSVSARLNYLWILRNTHCLRENLRKFVQPPVRKPRSMGRHLQQSGHASEVWCDSDFPLLPQVRTLVYLHPPPISTTLLNRTFHHPICWCAQAQPIAQMKRKHFKNIWGLNIIFKLIQEVLYICPEFRNSLIWDGSKMKFCIWCNHNIVKAVIPTASSSWQQLKLIPHGTFCAAAAFID